MQESVVFPYTNQTTWKEIKKAIPLIIATKILAINLNKEVKYLYKENYKKVMKETEEDTKMKISHWLSHKL